MRGFYTRTIVPWPLLLLLLVSLAFAAHAWSFSNVVGSIEKLLQNKRGPEGTVGPNDGNGGAPDVVSGQDTQDVTVQGRIIMVPRRSMGQCQPGQQLDRRGKCRTVW